MYCTQGLQALLYLFFAIFTMCIDLLDGQRKKSSLVTAIEQLPTPSARCWSMAADTYSFLLWQMGLTGLKP